MPTERSAGKPTTRRYSAEETAAAVRMVRALRAETGMTPGAVRRVAQQLGYGVESVRSWVKQADVDEGVRPGVTTSEAERVKNLERRCIVPPASEVPVDGATRHTAAAAAFTD